MKIGRKSLPGELWILGEDAVEWPIESRRMARRLRQALGRLPPRLELVIRLRHGVANDDGPMTLDQIAALWGISRPRVRQLEARAIRRLRSDPKLLSQMAGWLQWRRWES